MKTKRKQVKTIQAFLDYLDELGLTVYGQNMDASGCVRMRVPVLNGLRRYNDCYPPQAY